MKKLKKNSQVLVVGKKWFDKVNGNTYHSANVLINGEYLDGVDFEYGYGNAFEQTALKILQKHFKGFENVSSLWKIKELGYILTIIDSGYGLKKEL